MKVYENVSLAPKVRAQALLKELSLDEKMAQINCYYFPQEGTEDVHKEDLRYGIGVVSCLETRGTLAADAVKRCNAIQKRVMDNSPHHIPAIFHSEGVCGLLLADASSFPSNMARGATFDAPLEREIGKCVGDQAAQMNITHVFAPVLDVTRDARFGRMYESYGEDETLVAALGTAYAEGVQDNKDRPIRVEGVAKHFLGFHKGAGGQHGADVSVSERELREVYAKPFEAAIRLAGLKGVMPCYNVINGELASLSKRILTHLLRDELGFDGIAVSDYCAILNAAEVNHVAFSAADAGLRALSAGMDVEEQFPYGFGKALRDKFALGEADISILDRAVERVLEAKFRMGLFEHPFAEEPQLDRAKGRALSMRVAAESMVLLKNNGILPLKKHYKKIAVVGYHAGTVRGMFGGYTNFSMYEGLLGDHNTMAGLTGAETSKEPVYPGTHVYREDAYEEKFESLIKGMYPGMHTLTEQLALRFPESEVVFSRGFDYAGEDESGFEEALGVCRAADLVILALGGKCGTGARCSMGENVNGTNIGLPPAQEKFIRLVSALQKPMVGVHFDGRPISSDAADECLDAILECWNPSEGGSEAAVGLLAGDMAPSGRLPVTVARSAGQLPMYYSHPFGSCYHPNEFYQDTVYMDSPTTPRYYFGYGLSYTKFSYSDLTVDVKDGRIFCSVCVKNEGDMPADEVVQLYIRDEYATVARPNLQLVGFARVHLVAGEKKFIGFAIEPGQLAFLDEEMRWKTEAGEFTVLIGPSSGQLPLSEKFRLEKDLFPKSSERTFFASTL